LAFTSNQLHNQVDPCQLGRLLQLSSQLGPVKNKQLSVAGSSVGKAAAKIHFVLSVVNHGPDSHLFVLAKM
jgi:hypothetical protein